LAFDVRSPGSRNDWNDRAWIRAYARGTFQPRRIDRDLRHLADFVSPPLLQISLSLIMAGLGRELKQNPTKRHFRSQRIWLFFRLRANCCESGTRNKHTKPRAEVWNFTSLLLLPALPYIFAAKQLNLAWCKCKKEWMNFMPNRT
jgi:hypothetical protein